MKFMPVGRYSTLLARCCLLICITFRSDAFQEHIHGNLASWRVRSSNVVPLRTPVWALDPETDCGAGGPPFDPPGNGGIGRWGRGDGGDEEEPHHRGLVNMVAASLVCSTAAMTINKRAAEATSGDPTTIDPVENVSKGTSTLLQNTKAFWSGVFGKIRGTVSSLNPLKSKGPSPEELELKKLQQTVVTKVIFKNNQTVVPQSVLDTCAARANVIGSYLAPGPVQEMARLLKQYYQRQGYVLSGMTGATLLANDEDDTPDGIVEISVEEPVMASPDSGEQPVALAFAKKMVVHPETGQAMSLREYKKSLTSMQLANFNINKLNTTYVQTQGKTRPSVIANALGLEPAEPFRWSERDWSMVERSPIFQEVLQAEPVRLEDGSIQFRIICRERPVRNLEYGVSKSLFSDKWEGELGLEHGNVFGGGETLEISIKRAARDSEASYRVSYKDQDFCTPTNQKRGWAVEAFNEYIGTGHQGKAKVPAAPSGGDQDDLKSDGVATAAVAAAEVQDALSGDEAEPLIRKGLSYSMNNPLRNYMQSSHAQMSAEQVLSESGTSENIVSSVVSVGPFLTPLPRGGRHSVNVVVGVGSRLGGTSSETGTPSSTVTRAAAAFIPFVSGGAEDEGSNNLLAKLSDSTIPYGHVTATTRQIFPFSATSTSKTMSLAMRHSVSTCTSSIPYHRAVANAASVRVRGYGGQHLLDGSPTALQASIVGTTEVRIPVPLPNRFQPVQDASVVLFGDWLFAQALEKPHSQSGKKVCRQSSVGIGLRKSIQGIPLRYDVSLTEEGKIGAVLNFGRDFDVY